MRLWLLGFAVTSLLTACHTPNASLPEDVLGKWTTRAPQYQDRFFELSPSHLTFGTGAGTVSRNPITRIERTEDRGRALFRIEHLGAEGQSYNFYFYYRPENGGTITLKNQGEIQWNRERGQGA